MSGAGLVIETGDLTGLEQRLERLYLTDAEMRRLLGEIGAMGESQTRRRIAEEKTDPQGNPWPELDEKYAARKAKKSSGGLLEFDGHLIDSIDHEVSSGQVEISTNMIYGTTHQMGDEDRNIEARAYLGLSEANREDVEDLTEDFIRRLFA